MSLLKPLVPALALALSVAAPESRAGGEGHGHPNHAALFVGATVHDSHVYPTVGLDYERLLAARVGAVVFGELIVSDPLAQIAGAGLAYHPVAPVKLAALGGVEHSDGHSAFLVRGTLEYAFHAGPVAISPSASIDYVDEAVVYVLGAAVGMGF